MLNLSYNSVALKNNKIIQPWDTPNHPHPHLPSSSNKSFFRGIRLTVQILFSNMAPVQTHL